MRKAGEIMGRLNFGLVFRISDKKQIHNIGTEEDVIADARRNLKSRTREKEVLAISVR